MTWHLYSYCANNPINYVDPSGHKAFWLNATKGAYGRGHSAILLKHKGKWRYYSWEGAGYKSKSAQLKTVKKGIKGSKITKAINKAKNINRTGDKRYNQYFYIKKKISIKGSYKFAKEIKDGKHYTAYNLATRNCAWVATDILRHGNIGKTRKSKLWNLQYYWRYDRTGKHKTIRTINPNVHIYSIAKVFSADVKKIK